MFTWISNNYKLFLIAGVLGLSSVYLIILLCQNVSGEWHWHKKETTEEKWTRLKAKYLKNDAEKGGN